MQNPTSQPWLLAGFSLLANIGLWIGVMTTFPRNTPAAVLHYSVGVGIDFIGHGQQIVVLPAVATGILLLNIALAFGLRKVSRAATWIILSGAAIVQVLLIAAYSFILLLNR